MADTSTDYSKMPKGLKWRSNTLFILSTVGIALFTDLFLYGIIVPILPFILNDRLSLPHSQIQIYTSILLACYAGASFLFSIPAGVIADKLPARQLPFLVGLVALLMSTILLAVGQSIGALILARILQGTSAAVVWTIGMALIMDTVGSKKLGVTIGSIFPIVSVGELVAPILGGVVYKKAGNGAVFAMGFGLLAIDFIMRLFLIEKKVAKRYGLEDGAQETGTEAGDEEAGEDSPLLLNGKSEQWIIPENQSWIVRKFPILYCLSNSRLLTAQAVAFMQGTLLAVFDATIPTEAQDLFGFDSLQVGLVFTGLCTPYIVLGPIAGKAVDKYGVKPAAALGFLFQSLPLFLLRFPKAGGTPEIVKFSVLIALCGIGMSMVSAPSIVEASCVTELYHKHNPEYFGKEGPYAQLYAINSVFFCLGLTFGPLISGGLRDAIGYGNMNAVMAGLCLFTSALSFVYLGGRPRILGAR